MVLLSCPQGVDYLKWYCGTIIRWNSELVLGTVSDLVVLKPQRYRSQHHDLTGNYARAFVHQSLWLTLLDDFSRNRTGSDLDDTRLLRHSTFPSIAISFLPNSPAMLFKRHECMISGKQTSNFLMNIPKWTVDDLCWDICLPLPTPVLTQTHTGLAQKLQGSASTLVLLMDLRHPASVGIWFINAYPSMKCFTYPPCKMLWTVWFVYVRSYACLRNR